MSLDIDWSLLSSSDPSSLISLLNKQLSQTSRPSFIGPISITSFSYGTQGPLVEIRDIRDVWRVFDQGDEEGDLDLELLDQEKEKERRNKDEELKKSKEDDDDDDERDLDGLDGKYEIINYDGFVSPNRNGNGRSEYDSEYNSRYKRQSYNPPQITSISRPHARPTSMPPTSFISTSNSHFPLPYAYTPHLPSTPGLNPSMSMFSPHTNGFGGLPLGMGMSLGRGPGSAASVVGVGLGSASLSLSGRRPLSISGFPTAPGITQSQYGNGNGNGNGYGHGRPIPRTRHNTQTQTSSIPTSPPARPINSKSNDQDQDQDPSKQSSLPSLQLHLHVSHSSDLQITLLTSLQVNYPSKSFMALPLKLVVTGFTLDAEVILAFNGDKNRLHLTIVDEDGVGSSGEHLLSPSSSSDISIGIPKMGMGGEKGMTIGQRLLPNLQIESEIGHSDAHVLRNVGKVERFIVDVVRKTLVEELVFPNFHTVEL